MDKPEIYVKNKVSASLALVALKTAAGAKSVQIDQYQYLEPDSCANTKISFAVPDSVSETELIVKSVDDGEYNIQIGATANSNQEANFTKSAENRPEPKI